MRINRSRIVLRAVVAVAMPLVGMRMVLGAFPDLRESTLRATLASSAVIWFLLGFHLRRDTLTTAISFGVLSPFFGLVLAALGLPNSYSLPLIINRASVIFPAGLITGAAVWACVAGMPELALVGTGWIGVRPPAPTERRRPKTLGSDRGTKWLPAELVYDDPPVAAKHARGLEPVRGPEPVPDPHGSTWERLSWEGAYALAAAALVPFLGRWFMWGFP